MFTFSEQHAWQGNEAVQQILVFPNYAMQEVFNKDFADLVEKQGIESASDSNLGAIYKLRAVKNGTGKYIPVIRCGVSGLELWEGGEKHDVPSNALEYALTQLKRLISQSIDSTLSSKFQVVVE